MATDSPKPPPKLNRVMWCLHCFYDRHSLCEGHLLTHPETQCTCKHPQQYPMHQSC